MKGEYYIDKCGAFQRISSYISSPTNIHISPQKSQNIEVF